MSRPMTEITYEMESDARWLRNELPIWHRAQRLAGAILAPFESPKPPRPLAVGDVVDRSESWNFGACEVVAILPEHEVVVVKYSYPDERVDFAFRVTDLPLYRVGESEPAPWPWPKEGL